MARAETMRSYGPASTRRLRNHAVREVSDDIAEAVAEAGHAGPASLDHRVGYVEADGGCVGEGIEADRCDRPVAAADVEDMERSVLLGPDEIRHQLEDGATLGLLAVHALDVFGDATLLLPRVAPAQCGVGFRCHRRTSL